MYYWHYHQYTRHLLPAASLCTVLERYIATATTEDAGRSGAVPVCAWAWLLKDFFISNR